MQQTSPADPSDISRLAVYDGVREWAATDCERAYIESRGRRRRCSREDFAWGYLEALQRHSGRPVFANEPEPRS